MKRFVFAWLLPAAVAMSAEPAAWWNAMLTECRSLAAKSAASASAQPRLDFGRSDFTIMAWVTTTHGGTILAKAPASGPWVPQGKTLFVRDGHVVFDIGWVGNITSRQPVANGKRHHVALVSRGGGQRVFVDGVPDAAGRLRAEPDRAAWVVKLGRTADNFGGDFQGTLEDVRLYASALSDAEVK
ncbi:MAG: LamG domain-containing protein, partial [Verrucomicrobia bacterium]|nr:LamG domain-containing protein [Verrucomicrobiota bacterium]